jgi:hypothetical protein
MKIVKRAHFIKDINKAVVKELNFCIDENASSNEFDIINIEDEYDSEYFKSINDRSDTFGQSDSCFINELFLYYYISGVSIYEKVLRKYEITNVSIKFWDKKNFYLIDACKKNNIKVKFNFFYVLYLIKTLLNFLQAFFNIIVYSLITIILPLRFNKKKSRFLHSSFSLIHSKASLFKIRNAINFKDIEHFYDPLTVKVDQNERMVSIYSVIGILNIFSFIITIPIKSFKYIIQIIRDGKKFIGYFSNSMIAVYYSKRVSHFVLLEKCLELIFKRSNAKEFYSGEKETRQGILEMKMGEKFGKKSIGIPHGLEFSYKFPKGLFGDVFYCTNQYSADYLNNLYTTNKFLFDKEIINRMFCKNYHNDTQRVVFFTEPRNIDVNVLILKYLSTILEEVSVKLHPLDSKRNYKTIANLSYIDDFKLAISNNICIARKSTILIEALYNQSIPIAVLIDKKDRFSYENIFPALNTPEIKIVYEFDSLGKIIMEFK